MNRQEAFLHFTILVYIPGIHSKRAFFAGNRCVFICMVSRLTLYTGGVGLTVARAVTLRISVRTFTVGTVAQITVCVHIDCYHQERKGYATRPKGMLTCENEAVNTTKVLMLDSLSYVRLWLSTYQPRGSQRDRQHKSRFLQRKGYLGVRNKPHHNQILVS